MDPTADPNAVPSVEAAPAPRPSWLQQIEDMMGGYSLTDDDLMMLANYMMQSQMQQQIANTDYQFGYLDYLNRQLGLNEKQLALAEKEVAHRDGPYYDWYVQEYFPMMQEQERLKMETAQVTAGYEQQRARDYALSAAYQTEQSRLGTEAARYQYLTQTLGVNPVRNGSSQYAYRGY